MKKPLLPLVFFVACALTTSAFAASGKNRYGLELGPNIANANTAPDATSPTTEQSSHLGFAGGLLVDYSLTSLLYFSPEVLYVQKGANSNAGNLTIALNYLDFPLSLKAKLDFGNVIPFIFTGPDLAFLLSSNATVGGVTTNVSNFNTLDFAWNIGAGLEIALTPDVAILGNVRYSMGLIDVDTNASRWYSRDVMILVGASVAM